MGQCYSVRMKLKIKDEKALIDLMNGFIKDNAHCIDFSLPSYAKRGIGTETVEDLVKIMITDREFSHEGEEYESDFNACYGWESVMLDMFSAMAPALKNGSVLWIYPDHDYDRLVVKNGVAIQTH